MTGHNAYMLITHKILEDILMHTSPRNVFIGIKKINNYKTILKEIVKISYIANMPMVGRNMNIIL